MRQSDLWHDTSLDAVGASVEASGGKKRVASKLWPTLDPANAASRLRGGLNPEHAQKLDIDELIAIARLAKEVGDHTFMLYLGRVLGYEIKPLNPEEVERRARRLRRVALLDELKSLEEIE